MKKHDFSNRQNYIRKENTVPQSIYFFIKTCSEDFMMEIVVSATFEFNFNEGYYVLKEEFIEIIDPVSYASERRYKFDIDDSKLKKDTLYQVKIFCKDGFLKSDCFGTNYGGAWIRYFGVGSESKM